MDPISLGAFLWIVSTAMGAAFGADSYKTEYNNWLEDVAAEEARQLELLGQEKDRITTDFNVRKDENEHQATQKELAADRSDYFTDKNEGLAAQQFGDNFDLMQMQFEESNENLLQQRMQADSQKANGLSAMAASGTRSSSMAQAIDLEAANNSVQLELASKANNANYNYSLTSLINNLSQSKNGIQQNRWQAMDLRNDAAYMRSQYEEGGGQYSIYQLNLNQAQANYDAFMTESERQKTRAKNNYNKGLLNAIFGGAANGFKFGSQIYGYDKDKSNPIEMLNYGVTAK